MKALKKISIIGLGAIGAAYAGKLYDMDPGCISIIADKGRIERYTKEGVYINGKRYDFKYVSPEEECESADLIMAAVKFHNLEQTVKDIRNHVGKDTIIISLMNGISSEEIIGSTYGMDRMLYAMCVEIDAQRNGSSINYTTFGQVHFGEKINTVHSPKVEAVKDLFGRAHISYVVPENMMRTLWWKFMVNVGVNQTSAVLRAPYGVFQRIEEAREYMKSAMREVIAVSQKAGVNLVEDDIYKFSDKVLLALSPEGKTSMLQDIDAGRKTEVEMLSGALCELGGKYGVETPVNDNLFKMIKILEKMNGM